MFLSPRRKDFKPVCVPYTEEESTGWAVTEISLKFPKT
jgi:hypothetical protein